MRFLTVALLALVPTLASAQDPVRSAIEWRAKYDTAYREMQNVQRPMLLFIKSDACLYCKRMEASTYRNPHVINEVNTRFVPAVVNSTTHPELAKQFNTKIYPTTVIISADGKIVDTIPGYLSADQFQSRLRSARVR